MSYHDKRNPAGASGGASESVQAGNRNASEVKPNNDDKQEQLKAELAAARLHLERRAHNNAVMAAWKEELQARLARAELRFEAIGLHADEQHFLQAEVEEFRRVAKYLNWNPIGRAA